MTMNGPIITSLLDTDLYKLTMMQAALHRFPAAQATYRYRLRNEPAYPLVELKADIEREVDHLCSLHFTADELGYLGSIRYLKSDFVDFLEIYRLRRRFLQIEADPTERGGLAISAQGPMLHTMLFEIYVLAIVSELYFRRLATETTWDEGERRLEAKIARLRALAAEPQERTPYLLFDFGTRRRLSKAWHERVVARLAREAPQFFKGTSNLLWARRFGLTPIGTMAHEYLQAHQALGTRLRDFQKAALENWVMEYRGDLGIALSDVVGMDAFLADFDLYFTKLFDGMRHDSGDPVEWGGKAIRHYEKLRTDPLSKMLVFSNELTIDSSITLWRRFGARAKTSYGIGTHLTNDCGLIPLNEVIKLVACNDQPVAKISDSPGKGMSIDERYLAYLRQVFGLPPG